MVSFFNLYINIELKVLNGFTNVSLLSSQLSNLHYGNNVLRSIDNLLEKAFSHGK